MKGWSRLLANHPCETQKIDFKRSMAWDGHERGSLTADIAAMANTGGGGKIIIGVDDDHTPTGVTPEHLATWDVTKVADYVNRRVEPEVLLTIEKLVENGLTLLAVNVSEFSSVPHVLSDQLNGPGKSKDKPTQLYSKGDLLMRTKRASTCRISSAEDMRELLMRAARRLIRTDLLDVSRIRAEDHDQVHRAHASATKQWRASFDAWMDAPGGAVVIVTVLPAPPIGSGPLSTAAKRQEAFESSELEEVSPSFPTYDDEPSSTGDTLEGQSGGLCVWQLCSTGAFFYCHVLDEDGARLDAPVLSLQDLVYAVASSLAFAERVLRRAKHREGVRVDVMVTGARGRRLVERRYANLPVFGGLSLDDEIPVSRALTMMDLGGRDGEAVGICLDILQSFGGEYEDVLRRLLARNTLYSAP